MFGGGPWPPPPPQAPMVATALGATVIASALSSLSNLCLCARCTNDVCRVHTCTKHAHFTCMNNVHLYIVSIHNCKIVKLEAARLRASQRRWWSFFRIALHALNATLIILPRSSSFRKLHSSRRGRAFFGFFERSRDLRFFAHLFRTIA